MGIVPRPVVAQGDPRQAQAQALFDEGVKLHNADHEQEALVKFVKANGLFPTPNALFWIAREEQLTGKPLEALRHYREALKNPLATASTIELGKRYIAELEPRFAKVAVRGPAGATLIVGEKQLRLPIDEPVDVEPGTIALRAERDGLEYAASGAAEAGKTLVLELRSSAPLTAPPHEEPRSSIGWLLPVGLGVGALAGLGVGLGFASAHKSSVDDANAIKGGPSGTNVCADASSAACVARQDKLSTASTQGTLSTASYIVGGVFAAGAIASALILYLPRSSSSSVAVAPIVGRGTAGLQLFRSF